MKCQILFSVKISGEYKKNIISLLSAGLVKVKMKEDGLRY